MNMRSYLKKYLSYNTVEIFNKKAWQCFVGVDKVLDVACGSGRFIAVNPERAQGIDSNPHAVQHCQAQGYKVIKGDALDLPFADNSFSGVHCAHLIEHLYPQEAWKLLCELTRIVEPGGILVLQAPLLSRTFYHDMSHIKPYPPQAILEYLRGGWKDTQPQTFGEIGGKWKIKKLSYRHLPLGVGLISDPFLKRVFEVLARLGMRSLKRSAYLLAVEKISSLD